MNKLLMLKGLPGSGKTTYAKELVEKGWKRVNKDDLRAMIDTKWKRQNEEDIKEVRDLIIIHYLDNGHNVVVDDTNFDSCHKENLLEIADNCDAEFEEKFFDVPIFECIERDLKRGDKSVGSKVILGMYFKYLKPDFEWRDDRQNAFIFDIDGTLALMNGRSPYDYTKVDTDVPNYCVTMLLRIIKGTGLLVLIVSGRKAECRDMTEEWLRNNHIPYDALFMRRSDDDRKDAIIKSEIYDSFIEPEYNIVGVFDDRNQVVDMWRSKGLTVMQVGYGNF